MRRSPSIASSLPDDVDVYLVLDDFGNLGRSWREIDEEQTDRETIITDLMRGEFNSPVRVIAFNTAEGWSRKTSPKRSCSDSTRRPNITRRTSRNSSIDTRQASHCSCHCR
jgi:hypothetical protein